MILRTAMLRDTIERVRTLYGSLLSVAREERELRDPDHVSNEEEALEMDLLVLDHLLSLPDGPLDQLSGFVSSVGLAGSMEPGGQASRVSLMLSPVYEPGSPPSSIRVDLDEGRARDLCQDLDKAFGWSAGTNGMAIMQDGSEWNVLETSGDGAHVLRAVVERDGNQCLLVMTGCRHEELN